MRKVIKNVIIILLILGLGASTAYFACLHILASKDSDLSGEWMMQLDMTKQASVTAFSWLREIEAVTISLEEVESDMRGLTVWVNLTLEQTGRSNGTFNCYILPESYEACRQAAYEAFAEAFRRLLAERLRMAGYVDGTDTEAIEALVEETFGMSTVSYLMSQAPALLPSLEELQAAYDGSGTYEAEEGVLTRYFDEGAAVPTRTEQYVRQESSLVLLEKMDSEDADVPEDSFCEYPLMYRLAPSAE